MFCSNCGNKFAENAGFCSKCGAPRQADTASGVLGGGAATSAQANVNAASAPSSKNKKIIGIVAAVLAVVLVAAFVRPGGDGGNAPSVGASVAHDRGGGTAPGGNGASDLPGMWQGSRTGLAGLHTIEFFSDGTLVARHLSGTWSTDGNRLHLNIRAGDTLNGAWTYSIYGNVLTLEGFGTWTFNRIYEVPRPAAPIG